jgi:ABC-2 type transport system permease protein
MNPIDKFLLWFFLLPSTLYEKAGVDILHLKAILSAKLTMDNRRAPAFGKLGQNREKKVVNRATLVTMFGSFVLGMFLLYSFGIRQDMVLRLALYFSMFIVMLCMTLITDFTSVLIDVRDNMIILPKPITDATFVTARLLHITIRTSIVVIPLTLPACIMASVIQGPAIILPFVLMVLLSTLFSIFLINAVYILILKITTPTKFQSIISYIQIGFTVFIYAGFQILPRLMNQSVINSMNLSQIPYIRIFPPFWFAESCMVLTKLNFTGLGLISLALSVLVPFFSIWLVIRVFAPSFNRKLAMINAGTVEDSTVKTKKGTGKIIGNNWLELLASRLTQPGSEYMGFLFGWKMMSRSRDFKMKVYPAFGYVLVIMVLFIYQSPFSKAATSFNHEQKILSTLLLIIYFSSFGLISALMQLQYSDKFKAAWLFNIAPIASPGKVISGGVKSAMVFFYVPIVLILLVVGILLMGPKVIPNLLLGCCNVLTIGAVISYVFVRKFPFSMPMDGASKGGTFIRSLISLIVPGGFGVIHWLISGYTWMVVVFLLLTAIIPWLIFDEIKKLSWAKVS